MRKRLKIVSLLTALALLGGLLGGCGKSSTNQEQNEHRTTIQMVGNVFVLFCEIPNVTLT